MSTPEQPTGSGPTRRRAQRYKQGRHQTQLGSQAISNIFQILHRKGQTRAPPDMDERSLTIGRFHNAPLNARMLSSHVYPIVGQRGELDNDCLYIRHPSRRLDLQSLLALRPISVENSPDLIDNIYLTGVHSKNSATTSAFMIHIYLPDSTPKDIINIIAAQLDDMHKQGIHASSAQIHNTTTIDSISYTFDTTFLDDEPIASGTYVTSSHLEGPPPTHTWSPSEHSCQRHTVSHFWRVDNYDEQLPYPIQESPPGSPTTSESNFPIRPRRAPGRSQTACSPPMTLAQFTTTNSRTHGTKGLITTLTGDIHTNALTTLLCSGTQTT